MKIEDKDEVAPFEDYNFVTFIFPWNILVLSSHELQQKGKY